LFTYVPLADGARIDVAVSELYDSTYVGNPQDLVTVAGRLRAVIV
jgi:hypothetical protein